MRRPCLFPDGGLGRRARRALLECYRLPDGEEHDAAWERFEHLFEKLDDAEKDAVYRLQDRVGRLIARRQGVR